MNKEFIPYEQALELKELGFNEDCIACFFKYNNELYTILNTETMISRWSIMAHNLNTSAPLYQQAFRWFREKYGLDHFVQHHIDGTNQTYFSMARKSTWDVTTHDTYEEAELACLKKLIEIAKNK
jgi:hypothetical protein